MDPSATLWWGVPALFVVIGLVELAKKVGFPAQYAMLLAVAIGIVGGILSTIFANSVLANATMGGVVIGLMASGLWSGVKNASENAPKT
ncbi:MAG: hypothetical protein M1343_02995 [Chloroflexi bacterium]|nr:hypothetical protein [Chloroflexota bacterium]MDA8187151.1 hypothetical protein [Dehalococcoidales bacterium]